MKLLEKAYKNGKLLKHAYTLICGTGKGMGIAANTGYKAGYFLAKHPNIEMTKNHVMRNYKAGLLAIIGVIIGLAGFLILKKP